MTPTPPKAQTHAERLRMLVDEGFAPVRDHAALMAGAAAIDDVQRLREALPTREELEKTDLCDDNGWCLCCFAEPTSEDHQPNCWIARLAALLETPDQ